MSIAANLAPTPHRENVAKQINLRRNMIEARHILALVDPLQIDGGNVNIHLANVGGQAYVVQRLILIDHKPSIHLGDAYGGFSEMLIPFAQVHTTN